jgi:F-type H+-transporting ATPase subunit delta
MIMSDEVTHSSSKEKVFDVDVEKLSRVYAHAGLNAAGDLKAQQSLVDELTAVTNEVLDTNPALEKLFASALVSHEDKLGIIDRVFGNSLSATSLNFLKVIGRHGRLEILRSIIRSTNKLWTQRLNQVGVKLELAHAIDPALQQQMIDLIGKRLNAEPMVTVVINPDLIAGFVVRAGDRVLDASVRTNLERARHAMIDKAIEKIQQRPEAIFQSAET